MIIRENGLRYAKLIHVSVDNGKTEQSNKYYIMEEMGDGTIKCTYGRVGAAKPSVDIKSASQWNSVYSQKTSSRKGYVDKTDESVIKESSSPSTMTDISEKEVQKLFDDLMAYANKTIGANYKVSQDEVTQKQVDNAQLIIDELAKLVKSNTKKSDKIQPLNEKLLQLYTTIPRKMKNVKEHLFNDTDFTIEQMKDKIAEEQDLLDTMAGQVLAISQTTVTTDDKKSDGDKQESLLEKLGLEVTVEKDKKTLDLIKKLLGNNVNQLSQVFKCVNKATQERFDKHYASAKHKERKLLWHGSRNQNIFNLLTMGMMIRPSGVIHTGSMFGDGIYAANRAQKSIGYTSLNGSRWARGSSDKGYLLLYDIHLGNQKHIYKHDSSCYKLNYKDLQNDGFDSVYAHGGIDLINDEFIIYNTSQCTIAYVIELIG